MYSSNSNTFMAGMHSNLGFSMDLKCITHQVRTQHPHARICMYNVHFHGYIYVCFLKFLTYVHTCRYRILTYMCIQYGFYVTHMHVTYKVNRNKCKTLCAEYMCDIEIYVPHTCVT